MSFTQILKKGRKKRTVRSRPGKLNKMIDKITAVQSPKKVGNLGSRFLRKLSEIEEGLTRISYIKSVTIGGDEISSLFEPTVPYKRFLSYEATLSCAIYGKATS